MGRPSNITDETAAAIVLEHSRGRNLIEACRLTKVSFDSLCRKRDVDPEFRGALARAYGEGAPFYLAIAEDNMHRSTRRTFNRAREELHHARWRASSPLVAALQQWAQRQTPVGEVSLLEGARRIAFAFAQAKRELEAQRAPRPPLLIEQAPQVKGNGEAE